MNDPMGDNATIERAKPKGGMTPAKRRAATEKLKATLAAKKAAAERPVARAEAPVRRQSPRPAPPRAESNRDLARETPRRGAAVALGHGGERLTRRRITVGDQFAVPLNEIPQGWTYQWNTVTVLNQNAKEIERGDLLMHENGWRPVPASRHPGRWAPVGYEGSIIIEGLRLEERPASLTQEAAEEDTMRAKAQVRDRTDALRLTQKQLPGAGQAQASRAGPQMGMRMSIDPALDIPRPAHQVEDDGFEE
jgi:hypothetical protein